MPWIKERLAGTVNGTNVTFTISQTPNPSGSLLVFFTGLSLEAVGSAPDPNSYILSGTTITLGLAPTTGQHPWVNYFY